jgi:hypothetical protein
LFTNSVSPHIVVEQTHVDRRGRVEVASLAIRSTVIFVIFVVTFVYRFLIVSCKNNCSINLINFTII